MTIGGDKTIVFNETDIDSENCDTQKISIKGVDPSKFNYFPF